MRATKSLCTKHWPVIFGSRFNVSFSRGEHVGGLGGGEPARSAPRWISTSPGRPHIPPSSRRARGGADGAAVVLAQKRYTLGPFDAGTSIFVEVTPARIDATQGDPVISNIVGPVAKSMPPLPLCTAAAERHGPPSAVPPDH